MPQYPNLDDIVPIVFFSASNVEFEKSKTENGCCHLGYLIKDGFNVVNGIQIQRIKCSACNKRFGTNVSMYDLLSYQTQIKQLIYDLIIGRNRELEMSLRWQIPQSKISQFKKLYITKIFEEYPNLLRSTPKSLPHGILFADETFMGRMGNSNTEIQLVNADFQTIAAGPAREGALADSIQNVFRQIPEEERQKLRVLVTDGEPSYATVTRQTNTRIIHVQQLHAKHLLGTVIINKYQKFGPHYLHYIIYTHWKAFKQDSNELEFQWEIKFIKGNIQSGRGRPTKNAENRRALQTWRQKKEEYYSEDFKKSGVAKICVNLQTEKISRRAGATQWMTMMLTPVLKIFKEKFITNNKAESKHSQIKRKGASRKQQDSDYANKIFQVCAYLAEQKHLPPISLPGRPLYKFLMKKTRANKECYSIAERDSISKQLLMSAYIK